MISFGNLLRRVVHLLLIAWIALLAKGSYGQTISFDLEYHEEPKQKKKTSLLIEEGFTSRLLAHADYKNIKAKSSKLRARFQNKAKKNPDYVLGNEKEFFVRNIITGNTWITTNAVLSFKSSTINIWIQKSAYDTLSTSQDLEIILTGFEELLFNSTLANSISVIGAEKDKAPIRMAGGIYPVPELQDEANLVEQVQQMRNEYFSRHERYYRDLYNRYYAGYVLCKSFTFGFGCNGSSYKYAKKRMEIWQAAKLEIDNIGTTWSTIINSYRMATIEVLEYIPPCENGVGPLRISIMFDVGILPNGDECSTDQNGEYVYRPKEIQIPDKNDGGVNINSVLWSKGDAFGDRNNIFMSDIPADGGYNHFEIRNYKRAYSLPSSNGNPGFSEGDVNPAMLRVENWIRRNL